MTDQQIAAVSRRAAERAQPELDLITEDVIKRHKLDKVKIEQSTLVQVGLALNDVQHQSFSLGVASGIHLMLELMKAQADGKC